MDKLLLKKTAIQSLLLMLSVITLSFALKQFQAETVSADNRSETLASRELSSVSEQTIETKSYVSQSYDKNEKNNEADEDVKKQLGDTYFIIKKPEGDDLKLAIEDIYINKSMSITISGLANNTFADDMVLRVRDGKIYSGKPKYMEKISVPTEDEKSKDQEKITKDYGNDPCHNITIEPLQETVTKRYTAKLLIELDGVYAYQILENSDYYYINLMKPADVYDKILVIDAGHGGKDVGASSKDGKYYEKDINLDILLDLKELLDKEDIKVYYTRTKDTTVFLRPRVELANAVDCDYFISIHCNANEETYPNGTEILYYNKSYKGVKAIDLAALFSNKLGEILTLKNRGIIEKHADDIYIMNNTRVPMILIETGYLSNNSDMNYLKEPLNRKEAAKAIYQSIMKAYRELPVYRER